MNKIFNLVVGFLALGVVAFTPMKANAVAMPLDGSWVVLDEFMAEGSFFSGSWSWDSTSSVLFDITDLYVVTDVFEVYDFGSLVFSTPNLPDYVALGTGAFDPPYTTDPDVAWATPEFSKGSYLFSAGAHEITIRDIDIPTGFGDGTVAFRATVPEPAVLLLFGTGLLGLGLMKKHRRA